MHRTRIVRKTKRLQNQDSMDAAKLEATRSHVKSSVARALLTALATECASFCMLSGYDGLPDSFDTDIDFMVGRRRF